MVAYVVRALAATGWALLLVLGPALAIGAAMHAVADVAQRRAAATVGFRAYYYAGGWIGTAVHEAGHALFALLFGHEVTSVKWFDARARGGTLGHVRHRFDPWNPFHRVGEFFIGVGPLVLGGAVVWGAARWLLGPAPFAPAAALSAAGGGGSAAALAAHTWDAVREMLEALVTTRNLRTWRFWAFVYVAFAVGSGGRLSRSDVASVARGLLAIAAIVLVANLATLWSGHDGAPVVRGAARLSASYDALMLLVLAANVLAAALVLAVGGAARALWRRVG